MKDKGMKGERDRGIERDTESASCGEQQSRLQDYITRELDPESRRSFDAHLVECAECQRELALMTAVVSTLDHQPVLESPPGFGEKVLAALPRQRGFVPSPWWSLALAPVLAGLVWLFRVPVERGITGLLGRLPAGGIAMPTISIPHVGIVAVGIVGLGLLVAVGAAAFGWTYIRD